MAENEVHEGEQVAEAAEGEVDAKEETNEPEKSGVESLPEWAQKRIKKADGEAARYRTELRAAQEALANAKTPEEFQAVTDDLAKVQQQLMIREHTEGIDKALLEAPWITWPGDEDGIKKVASELRKLAVNQAKEKESVGGDVELRGGLKPKTGDPNTDQMNPAWWFENSPRRGFN